MSNGEVMVAFGRKVRRLRKLLGLSAEEVAKRSGYLTVGDVARIERGECDYTFAMLATLSKGLGVEAGVLGRMPLFTKPLTLEELSTKSLDLFAPAPPELHEAMMAILRALGRSKPRPQRKPAEGEAPGPLPDPPRSE